MLLNCSWLLCETLLAKKKHWCRVPKPLGVENILAENGEIQSEKDNIWEKGGRQGQRGFNHDSH